MRPLIRHALAPALLVSLAGPAGAAEDLTDLERRWHDCVRRHFDGLPAGTERHAGQRAALNACKADEDAYVGRLMAQREADSRLREGWTLVGRAKALAGSAAGMVLDPVRGLIERFWP
ncbi:hypothetical protein [Methylobacterium oryzihabitans]|uniref:Lysozyme inhibitor LprI N-terminal domain-containing protein n=1 Tax=Methylobacterium oryzihabitans TaxID=2499852 RepID=A0A3S2VN27_9HYPH|nr:hypothetical protein [Methylobacterium oryzihabitans]RVU16600.1 hypothetical protein EOE48_16105 [Methylobacterium oryzihabitans]